MLKIAVLAVAATVAAPGYSASVDDADVTRLVKAGNERATAFQTLLEETWISGEARELGVVVTDQEVEEAIGEELESSRERKRWLRVNGLTEAMLRQRMRATLEAGELRARVAEPAAKSVTPEQVKAYVDAHPRRLPAARRLRLVTAKSRAEAIRIERKLKRGATWASVGGETTEFRRKPERVNRAVFRAKLNTITRYGRVVFEVVRHTPERPLNRAQQEQLAWEQLSTEAQQRALEAYRAQFTEKWRARTSCAAAYATHPRCP